MKTITLIMQHLTGLDDPLAIAQAHEYQWHTKIKSRGWMDLVIEICGRGPYGRPLVSVCHYGEQNGDAMRDPEMTFEVDLDPCPTMKEIRAEALCKLAGKVWAPPKRQWRFIPISFRNDYAGVCQEAEDGAIFQAEDGRVLVRQRLLAELRSFSNMWDRNLRDQGFLAAVQDATADERALQLQLQAE